MSIIEGSTPLHAPPVSEEARLRQASRDLEGVFVEQLFKAMRETVPENSLLSGGNGEQMFTGMMDSHLAAQVPNGWENGLGEVLYRQLRAALGGTQAEIAAPVPATPGAAAAAAAALPAIGLPGELP